MKSANRFLLKLLGGFTTALVVSGCAAGGVPLFKKIETREKTEDALPDVHPIRKERASAAAKKFDTDRNAAEHQAAAAEWRQGNFKACRDGLDKILHRDPEHRDSLTLLAEVELEQDRPDKAVEALRRGIAAHPEDAELSYKLALALEAAGEESEALHHFHVAVQLAPQEKKYADVFKHAEEHARLGLQSEELEAPSDRLTTKSPAAAEPMPIRLTSNDTTTDNSSTVAAQSDATPPAPTTASAEPAKLAEPASNVDAARPITGEATAIEAAAAAWDAGRKSECVKAVGELLARDPKHIEANILQVEIDLDAGRSDEARARIERLAIRNPQSVQVRRACGLTYQALGDAARAASAFAMAETLELGELEDTTPRSQLSRAALTRAIAATPLASESGNAANTLAIQPVSSAASVPAELPAVDVAGPTELAATSFAPVSPIVGAVEEAMTRPKLRLSAQQLLEKGEVFLKAGQFDDAERELSAAISANSCVVKTAAAAALAPLKYEQSALALNLAREGLKKYPGSAGLHRIEGTAALRLGKHLEAEAALRQSLSLDNSQALTYFLLGSVYDRLGNQEAADRHLKQAARLDRRYASRK